MRRAFVLLSLLALSSLPCAAAVSGIVTDRVGNRLFGVGVSLALAGTSTTTDAKGTWSLAPTGIDARMITSRTRWTGKAVELTLAEPATISIEAYDLKGAQQGRLSRVKLGAGSHSLPLALSTSGMVWLRVTVNGRSEMVLGGVGMGGASVVGVIHESPLPNPMAARSQGIADTLLFTWKAKVVARIALSNQDTSGIVVKFGTDSSIAWNDSITYGNVYDARDGQVYRAVKIGSQWWMAENLNYAGNGTTIGVCYNSSADSCTKYGRLYKWAAAMGLNDYCNTKSCASQVTGKRQGVCPTGWHVPSDSEWTTIQTYVEPTNTTDGMKLKSTAGWNIYNGTSGNGTDVYGFRALPGGYFYGTSFDVVGYYGGWWSATEDNASYAWYRYMYYYDAYVVRVSSSKTYGFSLRCVEDYATVAPPTFTPNDGMYTSVQSVTLSTTTSGASIYFTVDGSTPTSSSTAYSGAIAVSTSETIRAIAVKSGMTNSTASSAAYTIIPWQTGITYGSVTYAGQTYKTVVISTQTWMAENLNYSGSGTTIGVCYNTSADSCTKYGRLYTWSEVMAGHVSSTTSPSGVQGICPSGWHVPSYTEWWTMLQVADASNSMDGWRLKSTAGWDRSGNGADVYGFRALPGGDFNGTYFSSGDGYWWSTTESSAGNAWLLYMGDIDDNVYRKFNLKTYWFSLRCTKDDTIPATVASPTFSPAAGTTYTSAQSVTLSTTTSGASIYYTVDGRTPTSSSTPYSGAISVSTSETIRAIAVKWGMTNSAISSAAYTITP